MNAASLLSAAGENRRTSVGPCAPLRRTVSHFPPAPCSTSTAASISTASRQRGVLTLPLAVSIKLWPKSQAERETAHEFRQRRNCRPALRLIAFGTDLGLLIVDGKHPR